jgi:hypothetical protein
MLLPEEISARAHFFETPGTFLLYERRYKMEHKKGGDIPDASLIRGKFFY